MVATEDRPWERLAELLEEGDRELVLSYLEALPTADVARAISRLPVEAQSALLTQLDPGEAADLVDHFVDVQAASMIELLEPETAAAILDELPSADQADLLCELEDEQAEAILQAMSPEEAEGARALSAYEHDVAGGLMLAEFLTFRRDAAVADVLHDLGESAEKYRDYDVQYAYVVGDRERLVGVLRLRDLLLARRSTPIEELMIADPLTVLDTAPLEELDDFFDHHHFLAVPVVDAAGAIVGVVRRNAVEEALGERGASDYRKSQGIVGGEELRTMPLLLRSRRRLSWLCVNVLLNIGSVTIIAMHQDTLAAVIALTVFLPIISDMSGCSGNQAVAVSMRELTLGLVSPREVLRVWGKEAAVGVVNGVALGVLVAAVAWVWSWSPYLGLVVGVAMMVNTIIAVSIGGTIPLILKRFNLDPALASGPILTTVTDMSGFLLVLGLASSMLDKLVG